jgi:hypothetical protein
MSDELLRVPAGWTLLRWRLQDVASGQGIYLEVSTPDGRKATSFVADTVLFPLDGQPGGEVEIQRAEVLRLVESLAQPERKR